MKIVLFGNVANNFYRLAKSFANNPHVETQLLISDSEEPTNLPEHDDPQVRDAYPKWISRSSEYRLRNLLLFKKSRLRESLEKADVVLFSSINVLAAPILRDIKTVFYATGADLTLFPFSKRHMKVLLDSRNPWSIRKLFSIILSFPLAAAMRLSIRSCDLVVAYPFKPFRDALTHLQIPANQRAQTYLPLAIDIDTFTLKSHEAIHVAPEIKREFDRFNLKLFAPARLMTNDHPAYVSMGQFKQNDLLVRGFASFVKENNAYSAGLFLIDRGLDAAYETVKLKELIQHLEITDNVVWLKPKHGNSFDRYDLIDMYSMSDVVADDFGVGWFGSVTLEGLSCSKPVMCFVEESTMNSLYPWHPLVSVNNVADIKSFLEKIQSDRSFAKELGREGRAWIEQFHSPAAIHDSWQKLMKEITTILPYYEHPYH